MCHGESTPGCVCVCVYIDDILITGTTEQEHLSNLAQVLQRLDSAGMRRERSAPSYYHLVHT